MTLTHRPSRTDLATILLLASRALLVVALTMLIPAVMAAATGDVETMSAMLVGACLGLAVAGLAQRVLPEVDDVRWSDGMVASGVTWLVAPVFCAVPLHLSGHFPSFFHAYFDAMSGLTCTGLSVLHDLDHLPDAMNLWRHLMQFLGGQGIVLVVLTFFAGGGGAVGMYAGEGREDKILPNVRRTARFIWRASLVYLLFGGAALTAALAYEGMDLPSAVFHAVNLFFAAFDTGGFAPRSSSVAYYHSAVVEAVLIVLMVAGAISFALHYRLWQGDGRELLRNLETRVLAATATGLFGLTALGLAAEGIYGDWVSTMRRGLFQLVSAHSGAGFATVPSAFLGTAWGQLAPLALVLAMGIGGMAGSTTGGVKGIRIGLIAKVLGLMGRQATLPPDAHVTARYHHMQVKSLEPDAVRAATTVLLLFIGLYLAGTVVGLFYGYPLQQALFESTSAAGGVGLSVGITAPSMEAPLMATYIGQMYLGRLEFISALAMIGYGATMVSGRR